MISDEQLSLNELPKQLNICKSCLDPGLRVMTLCGQISRTVHFWDPCFFTTLVQHITVRDHCTYVEWWDPHMR